MSFLALMWSLPGALEDAALPGAAYVTEGWVEESRHGDVSVCRMGVRIPNPGGLSLLGASDRYATLMEGSDWLGWTTVARGRLVAVPSDVGGSEIEVIFEGVPSNEQELLRADADARRIGEIDYESSSGLTKQRAEEYDPLYFARDDDDPLSVLVATLDYYRWDRVSNTLSRMPMNSGSNRTLHEDDGFGDVSITMTDPPRSVSRLRVTATWTQEAKGVQTFPIEGSVKTYSFEDLKSALPQQGSEVGSGTGWHFAEVGCQETPDEIPDEYFVPVEQYAGGDENVTSAKVLLQARTLDISLRLGYDYQQQREDVLTIEMHAGVQDVLGDDREEPVDQLQLAALNLDTETPDWEYEDPDTLEQREYAVGDKVQANGKVYRALVEHDATERFLIGIMADDEYVQLWERTDKKSAMSDLRSAKYWDTPRGERSRNHAIRRLRRKVVERAYCVEVSFACSWEFARGTTTAHTVTVHHPLHGTLTGRVNRVRLNVANDGSRMGEITMLCPVGTGGNGNGGSEEIEGGGVTYDLTAPTPRSPVNGATLPSVAAQVDVVNDYSNQKTEALFAEDPIAVIQSMPTQVTIAVPVIREEDLIVRRCKVVTAPIAIPQGVNL